MPQLTHGDLFDSFGIAYRSIKGALACLADARAALVRLVDNAVADNQDATIKLVQRQLKMDMMELYDAADAGPDPVLLRPLEVAGNRVIKRFNDPIHTGGPRSEGLVFSAALGDPVVSPITGVVLTAGVMGGTGAGGYWGKRVAIQSYKDKATVVWLAHMDAIDVKAGDPVAAGEVIGRAGQSGNAVMPQVLLVVQNDALGMAMPNVPFRVVDPWPWLFDKDPSDAYYLEVPSVER